MSSPATAATAQLPWLLPILRKPQKPLGYRYTIPQRDFPSDFNHLMAARSRAGVANHQARAMRSFVPLACLLGLSLGSLRSLAGDVGFFRTGSRCLEAAMDELDLARARASSLSRYERPSA
jgi:hypothetical protein